MGENIGFYERINSYSVILKTRSEPDHFFNFVNKRKLCKFNMIVEVNASRQWRTQEFCSGRGGRQQIQLRTEDRDNGDLGAVAP